MFLPSLFHQVLCILFTSGLAANNPEIKYQLADDGVSFAVQCRDFDIHRMGYESKTTVVKARDLFNRGIKRSDTILVTGDKPCFAMMRIYRADSMDPNLVKLGDGRIRLQYDGKNYWFDDCEDIYTVFHPSYTEHRLRFGFLDGVTFRLIVSQADQWGIIAKVAVENKSSKSIDLKIDMVYGGLSGHGRTVTASYFSPDPAKENSNSIDLHGPYAVISEGKISDQVIVSSHPAVVATKEDTKVNFSFPITTEPEQTQSVYMIAAYEPNAESIKSKVVDADIESLMASSKAYYDDMLSKYRISTPSRILDAGFRTAVLNFDNIYQDPAWLEGVHWWAAYWTNIFQISAAISLGQEDRAKKALQFYNTEKLGPAPMLTSLGNPAGGNEEGLVYYLYELFQYYDHTGDKGFVLAVWPKLSQSLEQLFATRDKDGNGLLNWHLHCNAFLYQADHLGMPGDAASPSLMVAGMVERLSQIAGELEKTEDAKKWKKLADTMYANLAAKLWNQDAGCFYNHIDLQGLRHMGHYYTDMVFPVLYTNLASEYKWQSLEYLKQNLLLKDPCGKLSLMRVGELKPPVFGNDNVMPTQMAEAARAFFAIGEYEQGKDLLDSVALAGTIFTEAPGNFPERMSDKGKGECNYLFGNPIASFTYAVIRGLFGLSITDKGRTLDWSPSFCAEWDHASLELPYAKVSFQRTSDMKVRSDRYTVEQGTKRSLHFSTFLPPCKIKNIRSNGNPVNYAVTAGLKKIRVEFVLDPAVQHEINISYELREVNLRGPLTVHPLSEAVWQFDTAAAKISDPQKVLKKVSIKGKRIEAVIGEKTGSHQFFVQLKDMAVVYPVIFTSMPAAGTEAAFAVSKMPDECTECIDLSSFYNSSSIECSSYWLTGKQVPVRPDQFVADGLWNTPAGRFRVAKEGPHLAMIELGKSETTTQETITSKFSNKIVIPVGKKVSMLSLLYANEIQSRLTNSQVGAIRLVYDTDGSTVIPLVVGKNIDTILAHFASDTYGMAIGKEIGGATTFVNILQLSCDPNRVLQSVSLELAAADVQIGIMGVSVVVSKNCVQPAMPERPAVNKPENNNRATSETGTKLSSDLGVIAAAAAKIVEVKGESLHLSDEKPDSWMSGSRLREIQTLGPGTGTTAMGAIDPNSVIVRYKGIVLERGKDYLLDAGWGVLGIGPQSRVTSADVVEVDYRYSLRRIDSYIVDANGARAVVKGISDLTVPQPPAITEGQKRLANIFVDYFNDGTTVEVFPITETQVHTQTTSGRIPKILAKLQAGQEVRIVSWGDSVTEGGDVSAPEKRYPVVFEQMLKEKFPKAKIVLTIVAVGGSCSRQWLYPDKFKSPQGRAQDCLWEKVVASKPDLVTVEFVNDGGLAEPEFQSIYSDILNRLKVADAEVIFITPHFTAPSWMGFKGLKENENRPYVKMLKQFANSHNAAIADVSARWEDMYKHGIPYVTLLKNGVNHPDDRGHLLFAEELVKCFE